MDGICALCGNLAKLSFEHVPPQSAFNDKPILIQTSEHLTDSASRLYGKKGKSNKGFGSNTLCESCNRNTGSWYGSSFKDFAHQGMEILTNAASASQLPQVSGVYTIKALNVYKQIMTMFMSADKSGILRSDKKLTDFILDKISIDFPDRYKLFIYSNASPIKRMFGYMSVTDAVDLEFGTQNWCEINFQPFGYLLADNSRAPHKLMLDITSWHNFPYDTSITMDMTTAYLKVSSPIIGTYDAIY